MKQKPLVFLSGKAIYLRPLQREDLPTCLRWMNDPVTRGFILNQIPMDMTREEQWFDHLDRKSFPSHIIFAIVLKKGDRLIGDTGIQGINWVNRNAETGIVLGEESRGRGYGSEAAKLVLEYCFDTLGLHRVVARVLATNPRSLACHQGVGYRKESSERHVYFRNGQWIDSTRLAILEHEWRAVQKKKKR